MKHFSIVFIIIVFFLLGSCQVPAKTTSPPTILFPYQRVANIDRTQFNEPSGIVFHSQRNTLFVVGDEGDICEIQTDGTLVKEKRIRPADFEGITYDPSTNLLYVAVEGEEKIIEIDPDDFAVLRTFTIERTFEGKTALKPGGQGIEAITFVPDSHHPQGGTFYVANQSFKLDDNGELSVICEIELPLKTNSDKNAMAQIVNCFSIGVIDLSGLHYDANSSNLYVISDETNTFFEITKKGKILHSYAFPGDNQEGIAIDNDGFLYIAQDSGGIIKIKRN